MLFQHPLDIALSWRFGTIIPATPLLPRERRCSEGITPRKSKQAQHCRSSLVPAQPEAVVEGQSRHHAPVNEAQRTAGLLWGWEGDRVRAGRYMRQQEGVEVLQLCAFGGKRWVATGCSECCGVRRFGTGSDQGLQRTCVAQSRSSVN